MEYLPNDDNHVYECITLCDGCISEQSGLRVNCMCTGKQYWDAMDQRPGNSDFCPCGMPEHWVYVDNGLVCDSCGEGVKDSVHWKCRTPVLRYLRSIGVDNVEGLHFCESCVQFMTEKGQELS